MNRPPRAAPSSRAAHTQTGTELHLDLSATERLVQTARQIASVRDLEALMAVVRKAAREFTGADGATFVLREDDFSFYADEDAIAPLWKGKRFPLRSCISGWSMLHDEPVMIEDIYADERIPVDLYRPTFVKSLAIMPIRAAEPIGAIGNYWAERHHATERELKLLQALADLASVAIANVRLYAQLQERIEETERLNGELREAKDAAETASRAKDGFLDMLSHELRNPINTVSLSSHSLLNLTDTSVKQRRIAERIGWAANVLTSMVNDLLDAARIASGRLVLKRERLNALECVRHACRSWSRWRNRRASSSQPASPFRPRSSTEIASASWELFARS